MPNREALSELTEAVIAERLRRAYRPGAVVVSQDGSAKENILLKCAAVLIPLVWRQEAWHLVFTRRTDEVEQHKGQVSFPGGGCDEGETTPEQTALREAEEEIGLRSQDVRLLGRLNEVATITGYRITPIVSVMPWPYAVRLAPAEVKRVFTIPLLWLAERQNWEEQWVTHQGVLHPVVKYREYDGEILWGVSAGITLDFLSALGWLS